MMRFWLTLFGFLLMASTSSTAHAAVLSPFSDFYGTWHVRKLAGAASITESQQSADAAVGTQIRISAGVITTYNKHDTCKPRDPKVTEVDTERTLQSAFGARMSDLYLPEGTLGLRAEYLDMGCAFALVINRNTLLWPMGNGYIYTVARDPAE